MIAVVFTLAAAVAGIVGAPAPTPTGLRPLPLNPNGQGNIRYSKPTCPRGDPMVWLVPKTRTYYQAGSKQFGHGAGRYACTSGAVATGSAPGGSSGTTRASKQR